MMRARSSRAVVKHASKAHVQKVVAEVAAANAHSAAPKEVCVAELTATEAEDKSSKCFPDRRIDPECAAQYPSVDSATGLDDHGACEAIGDKKATSTEVNQLLSEKIAAHQQELAQVQQQLKDHKEVFQDAERLKEQFKSTRLSSEDVDEDDLELMRRVTDATAEAGLLQAQLLIKERRLRNKIKVMEAAIAHANARQIAPDPHVTRVMDKNEAATNETGKAKMKHNNNGSAAKLTRKQKMHKQREPITFADAVCFYNFDRDLRGCIRLHIRIRPFLRSEVDGSNGESSKPSLIYHQSHPVVTTNDERPYEFEFDKVYRPLESQRDVFAGVSGFIQAAMDGHNVCIFAYGPTGAGKTYTMLGSGNGQNPGIIPRAIEQIHSCEKFTALGWKFSLDVSFIEIHTDMLRDLLSSSSGKNQHRLKIRTDKYGKNYVAGLTELHIGASTFREQVGDILQLAAINRRAGRTGMDMHLPRSHTVFTMKIRGTSDAHCTMLEGNIYLVDLAGNVCMGHTDADDRFFSEIEANSKSLQALVDVFKAMEKKKKTDVPYRKSNLTQVLQPALSCSPKVLMVASVSPSRALLDECVCAMRFAQDMQKIQLGRAARQIKSTLSSEDEGPRARHKLSRS